MLDPNTPWFMFCVLFVVLDLIISGIIGIKRRKIHAESIALRIFTIPLGIFGYFVGLAYKSKPDEGEAAVASGVGAIGFGIFISIAFGFYYISYYSLLPSNIVNFMVRALLVLVIIGIPVSIAVFSRGRK